MKARNILLVFLISAFAIPALATSTSIFGNMYSGRDSMGFLVSTNQEGWQSDAPVGPIFIGFSTVGVPTTVQFGARAWQGTGYAEASGPWGQTTILQGGVGVLGTFTFTSTEPGPVSITIPAMVFASLQAYDEQSNALLGELEFTSHGRAILQGDSDGQFIQWNFGTVVFPAAVVPEPSTIMLVGSGLFSIVGVARRRRAHKRAESIRARQRA